MDMYKPHPLNVLTFLDETEITFLDVFKTTLKHLEIFHVIMIALLMIVPLQSPVLTGSESAIIDLTSS